jgi:hypothetical protein
VILIGVPFKAAMNCRTGQRGEMNGPVQQIRNRNGKPSKFNRVKTNVSDYLVL